MPNTELFPFTRRFCGFLNRAGLRRIRFHEPRHSATRRPLTLPSNYCRHQGALRQGLPFCYSTLPHRPTSACDV